jgi:hypothetical protein
MRGRKRRKEVVEKKEEGRLKEQVMRTRRNE